MIPGLAECEAEILVLPAEKRKEGNIKMALM